MDRKFVAKGSGEVAWIISGGAWRLGGSDDQAASSEE